MVDIASIVIAVISLAGTLLIGLLNLGYTWSSDQWKRNVETQKLVAKYRDPLLLAAQDLQSRIWSIVDGGVATFILSEDLLQKENLTMYTAFLIGQYLSWVSILRQQAQFLKFLTNKNNNSLTEKLAQITEAFAVSSGNLHYRNEDSFRLYRSQQMAVGELLTVVEGDEHFCMGYAAFRNAYDDKTTKFEVWFQPIITGIIKVSTAKSAWVMNGMSVDTAEYAVEDERMRVLQHLLMDLIQILDPDLSGIDPNMKDRCHRIQQCRCSACIDSPLCPSRENGRAPCSFPHGVPAIQRGKIGWKTTISKATRMMRQIFYSVRSSSTRTISSTEA